MSRFLNVLRSWLVMVSVIAMGNTVQSFRDHSFLSEKLYTGTPEFGKRARTHTHTLHQTTWIILSLTTCKKKKNFLKH